MSHRLGRTIASLTIAVGGAFGLSTAAHAAPAVPAASQVHSCYIPPFNLPPVCTPPTTTPPTHFPPVSPGNGQGGVVVQPTNPTTPPKHFPGGAISQPNGGLKVNPGNPSGTNDPGTTDPSGDSGSTDTSGTTGGSSSTGTSNTGGTNTNNDGHGNSSGTVRTDAAEGQPAVIKTSQSADKTATTPSLGNSDSSDNSAVIGILGGAAALTALGGGSWVLLRRRQH